MKFDRFLYGGDYNPEQWLDMPEILEQDVALMKKAHVTAVTLGVFSWSHLEKADGVYDLDYLAAIIDRLYENGISTILATPSGARPHWLADKYPEVLRVDEYGRRAEFGTRHNHCFSSPAYRRKVREMNTRLAARFDSHPGVILWHVSNEYGGTCYCPRCRAAFHRFLAAKYGTIDKLNAAWNTSFWSHVYDSFDQVDPPTPLGETSIQGLTLDYKRFTSYMTRDFMRAEIAALREAGAKKPVTINMMYRFNDVNYADFADDLDIISWDNYPTWHHGSVFETALAAEEQHDFMRSLKKAPFMMMESVMSQVNWKGASKLMRPGVAMLQGLQAIAHGSQSVLYFQWRKGRAGVEKFHGAVVDHSCSSDTRVFREVEEIGRVLASLPGLQDTDVHARCAVVYDRENAWAIESSAGPRNAGMHYEEAVLKCYGALRRLGVDVDVVTERADLTGYQFLAVPMLYAATEGFISRLRDFVSRGGVLFMTQHSAIVDENDTCYLGAVPHGLTDVLGITREEIDALYDGETNTLKSVSSILGRTYELSELCEIIHAGQVGVPGMDAEVMAVYSEDFYGKTPVLTRHAFGKGETWYLAANAEQALYTDLFAAIFASHGFECHSLPEGLTRSVRSGEGGTYIFYQNFAETPVLVPDLPDHARILHGDVYLAPYETLIVKQ